MLAMNAESFAAATVTRERYNECGVDAVLRMLNPC